MGEQHLVMCPEGEFDVFRGRNGFKGEKKTNKQSITYNLKHEHVECSNLGVLPRPIIYLSNHILPKDLPTTYRHKVLPSWSERSLLEELHTEMQPNYWLISNFVRHEFLWSYIN